MRPPRYSLAPAALATLLAFAAAPAHAQSAPAALQVSLSAMPLAQALNELARQANLQMSFPADQVAGRTAPAVAGRMSVQQALQRLLAGSGLRAEVSGNTIIVSPAGPASAVSNLPTVNVVGDADPVAARVNPPTTVGSKSPLTQREIPQTVSVVTQEQIQAQNMRSVDDALRGAPGVTIEVNQPGFTSYYSRGFPISSTQLDGVPTGIVTSGISGPSDGLAMYDRVEVLYGPAGLLNGFGGDGGVINLVRKRAPDRFTGSVQTSVGNYANSDLQADIGGPLNDAGTLRGRLVADEQYQHLMQESTWQRNRQYYGTLEADLTPTTLARVGFSYTSEYGKPMYGFPVYTNYTVPDIPRSRYLGPDWNRFSSERTNAFAQLEQKLGDGWTAKLSYNYMHTQTGVKSGAIITADPATGLSNRYSLNTDDGNTQNAVDLYVDGPFRLLGRTHHLTLGANYLRIKDISNQYLINPDSGLDFEGDITAPFYDNASYSSDWGGGPENDIRNVSTQYGVYGNMRISLADPLTFVASGRVTWWKNDSIPDSDPYKNFFGNTAIRDKLPAKFSPMLGLIYDVDEHHSLYGSYSSIYLPQAGYEEYSGHVIDPIEGYQYEIGEKSEFLDGKVNTNVALFRIREKNRAMSDPLHPGFNVAQGKAQSQGIELRANGQLTSNLVVGGGYTYTNFRNYDDSFTSHQSFSVITPKHLFKLWANYRLPGDLNKWTVGGAAYVSSKVTYTDTTGFQSNYTSSGGSYKAGGYATFDAHASYRVNRYLTATLSVANLFDRKYVTSLTTGGLGNYYGNPRTVLLTLKANF
ncbi:TonB-dependent siderophore receptor [Achromobacter aloeverae]